MRMRVSQRTMPMNVGMRFTVRIIGAVSVLVVFVMHMAVRVFEHVVDMVMIVMFHDMKVDSCAHENGRPRNCAVSGSPRYAIARTAPMKGAVEK